MNNVLLKGKKDKLVIQLNKDAEIESLKESLYSRLEASKDFFRGSKMAIEFSGRNLSDSEENELLNIISNGGIDITCFISEANVLTEPIFLRKSIIDEGLTKFHKGSLRSGHSIEAAGSVVILGDVNPGANIKAKGNIIVLGYLNGTAHAGGENEEGAFIVAFKMNPIQLRIAHSIARSPNGNILMNNRVNKDGNLEIAYIKDGQILVEDLNRSSLDKLISI